MDSFARREIGLDDDQPPKWDFEGFHYPYGEVLEMWMAWREHGVMPHAGGYLDQPPGWRADMRRCRMVYGVRAFYARQAHKRELERKRT